MFAGWGYDWYDIIMLVGHNWGVPYNQTTTSTCRMRSYTMVAEKVVTLLLDAMTCCIQIRNRTDVLPKNMSTEGKQEVTKHAGEKTLPDHTKTTQQ